MLIPIDEIYFKEKVKIKFDNIIQGFNNYKNKTIKAIDNKDFENKMLGFLFSILAGILLGRIMVIL